MTANPSSNRRDVALLIRAAGVTFLPVGLLARLPLGMTILGSVSLITATTGSLQEAGVVTGAIGVASAISAPFTGRAADRRGQRGTLLLICVLNAVALAGLGLAAEAGAPFGVLIALAIGVGAFSPQIGPMARARWIGIARGQSAGALRWAMGYESTIDEITFIVGPLAVAFLGTFVSPIAPLLVAAAMSLLFGATFATHPTHALVTGASGADRGIGRLLTGSTYVVLAGMIAMGAFWGAALTTLTSLAASLGHPSAGGFLYGAMGVTAAALALLSGAIPARFTLGVRWIAGAAIMLITMSGAAVATGLPATTAWFVAVGAGVGLTIVSLFSLAASSAAAGRTSTVMTLMNAGMILGQALTTAVNSALLSASGMTAGRVALVVISGAMLAVALVSELIRRATAASPPTI